MQSVSIDRVGNQIQLIFMLFSIQAFEHFLHWLTSYQNKSKKEGKDQESIQSSTTPDTEYQWERDNFTIRHHKREPRGQPFSSK